MAGVGEAVELFQTCARVIVVTVGEDGGRIDPGLEFVEIAHAQKICASDHIFAQIEQESIVSCKWSRFLIGFRPNNIMKSGIMTQLHSSSPS